MTKILFKIFWKFEIWKPYRNSNFFWLCGQVRFQRSTIFTWRDTWQDNLHNVFCFTFPNFAMDVTRKRDVKLTVGITDQTFNLLLSLYSQHQLWLITENNRDGHGHISLQVPTCTAGLVSWLSDYLSLAGTFLLFLTDWWWKRYDWLIDTGTDLLIMTEWTNTGNLIDLLQGETDLQYVHC